MTALDFQALAPHLTLTGALLLILLVVSFRRSHRLTAALTLLALVAAFAALPFGLSAGAKEVTPLLLLDSYAAFFNGLFIIIAAVTALLSHRYLKGSAGSQDEFYLCC